MDEELVQVRERTDPGDAEEPWRRPRSDPRDKPREVAAVRQLYASSLGEVLERAGKDQAGCGNEIAFAKHEVCGEILSGPSIEQRGRRRPELVEHAAQLHTLLRVEGAGVGTFLDGHARQNA